MLKSLTSSDTNIILLPDGVPQPLAQQIETRTADDQANAGVNQERRIGVDAVSGLVEHGTPFRRSSNQAHTQEGKAGD